MYGLPLDGEPGDHFPEIGICAETDAVGALLFDQLVEGIPVDPGKSFVHPFEIPLPIHDEYGIAGIPGNDGEFFQLPVGFGQLTGPFGYQAFQFGFSPGEMCYPAAAAG